MNTKFQNFKWLVNQNSKHFYCYPYIESNVSYNAVSNGGQAHNYPTTYEDILEQRGYRLGRTLGAGSYAKVKEKKDGEIYQILDHDSVIKVYDILEIGHKIFIFMELCEGGDLLDFIKQRGALSNSLAKKMFFDIVQAVRYCHDLNICHRDLKCENLLLDKEFHVKLADFGFARLCVDKETGRRILSRTYCGSAAYAAPEILQGTPYNPKLYDIWSMGCILFIMVCGSMPYDDGDVKKMLRTQLEGKVRFPSRVYEKLDPNVRNLIHKMLEVDVTRRATIEQVLRHAWLKDLAH
ncbi:hypothetical protein SNEBB_001131 [Seison nebaliae]|nr:hypothetical protein SNEBB_001131 [Seison nebaliae]